MSGEVERWREARTVYMVALEIALAGDALAAALEDTAAERDRAHATLREIVARTDDEEDVFDYGSGSVEAVSDVRQLARKRLENP